VVVGLAVQGRALVLGPESNLQGRVPRLALLPTELLQRPKQFTGDLPPTGGSQSQDCPQMKARWAMVLLPNS
jgi:hypothetical protein